MKRPPKVAITVILGVKACGKGLIKAHDSPFSNKGKRQNKCSKLFRGAGESEMYTRYSQPERGKEIKTYI